MLNGSPILSQEEYLRYICARVLHSHWFHSASVSRVFTGFLAGVFRYIVVACGSFAHVLISPILLLRVPIASSSIAVNKTVFVVLVHEAPLSVDNVASGCCLISGFVLVLLYCSLTLVSSVVSCGPGCPLSMLDPRR